MCRSIDANPQVNVAVASRPESSGALTKKPIQQELGLLLGGRVAAGEAMLPKLELLHKWLGTIQPTSIAPERAFSVISQFATPSLSMLMFMRAYYNVQLNVKY